MYCHTRSVQVSQCINRMGNRPCPEPAGFNILPLAAAPPFLTRQEILARRPPRRCGPSAIARGAGPVRPPSFVACEGREGRGQPKRRHHANRQSASRARTRTRRILHRLSSPGKGPLRISALLRDPKRVVSGKRGLELVELGGRRSIKKKKK